MYRILFANSDSSSDGAFSGFIFAFEPFEICALEKVAFLGGYFFLFPLSQDFCLFSLQCLFLPLVFVPLIEKVPYSRERKAYTTIDKPIEAPKQGGNFLFLSSFFIIEIDLLERMIS